MDMVCDDSVMWECDYCHLYFDSFREAEDHEKQCRELIQNPAATSFVRDSMNQDSDSLILLQDHGLMQPESDDSLSDSSVITETNVGGVDSMILPHIERSDLNRFIGKRSVSPTFHSVNSSLLESSDPTIPLCPDDIEFLKIDAIDDVIRLHNIENENILFSIYKTWRRQMGLSTQSDDELKCKVRQWFSLTHHKPLLDCIRLKRNVNSSPQNTDIADDQLVVMEDIDHLCYTVHATGLPCLMKTVMDPFSDTLYDFKVEVRQSSIENAGLGLFLTFLGARCLKSDVKRWSDALKADRQTVHVPTKEELVACLPDQSHVLVKLTGSNLHGNHNNPFFSITRFPLYAKICDRAKAEVRHVKVTLQGLHLHEDIDYLHAQGLLPSSESGFGWLGVFSESDYIQDYTKTFSSYQHGCGLVYLGRYGPFQKSDRKNALEFNVKDFIFQCEPAVWSFGSDKDLIDITEDSTGFPHIMAKDAVCMYCNEVGHDQNLDTTVLARDKDNGSIHYYIKIRSPLYFGESLELHVSYTSSYEESRERKGYGLLNKKGFPDDADLTERTMRNISDRLWLEGGIASSSSIEFKSIVSFTHNQLLIPIESFLKNCGRISKFDTIDKLSRNLVSRRRIKWLGEIFKSYPDRAEIDKITKMTNWKLDIKLSSETYDALKAEILEEWVFTIFRRYGNAHLYNPLYYCKLSRDLSTYLLEHVSRVTLSDWGNDNYGAPLGPLLSRVVDCVTCLKNLSIEINEDDIQSIGLRYHPVKTRNLPLLNLEEHNPFELDDLVIFLVPDPISRCSKVCKVSDAGKISSPMIYVDWYICQIVTSFHMIAERMVDLKLDGDSPYSLERLCASLDVNHQLVNSWIESIKVKPDWIG